MEILKITMPDDGQIILTGDLTFANINKKTVNTIDFENHHHSDNINIDLKAVKLSDSAGLALMIEWIKLSRQYNIQLKFNHIPEQLLTLAKLSGFENNAYFAK